jgi:hypothetical protein
MSAVVPPAGTPAAELVIDAALARQLVSAQHPDLADLPIRVVGSGWDNAMVRLGDDLALRLPRRTVAVQLLLNEQTWLPRLKDKLPLPIPAPVRTGVATERFPWPWSITPWMAGETADLSLPDADQGEPLAGFFRALHRPAPAEAPRNPVRGVPLSSRIEAFQLGYRARNFGIGDQFLTFQNPADQQADNNHDDGQFDEGKALFRTARCCVDVSH